MNGYSLVHMCAQYETLDILKFLVEYFKQCYRQLLTQQNVDVQNGVAPGNILSKEQIDQLIKGSINLWVNQMTPKDEGWTALHLACKVNLLDKGSNEIFKLILSLGADPYMRNKHGASLMHKAAKDDNTSLITFLRDKLNFSVSEKDFFENTPLHYSCFENTIYSSYWLIGFG